MKVNLYLSTENCYCDGYEGGGPRPFRVGNYKASSSSSNGRNKENTQTCSSNKRNQRNKGKSSKKTENRKNKYNCSKTKGNKKGKEDYSKNKENQESKGGVSNETQKRLYVHRKSTSLQSLQQRQSGKVLS